VGHLVQPPAEARGLQKTCRLVNCKQLTISRSDKTRPRAWRNRSYVSLLLGLRLPGSHGSRHWSVRTSVPRWVAARLQVRRREDAVFGNVNSSHHFVGLFRCGCLPGFSQGHGEPGGAAQEEPRPRSGGVTRLHVQGGDPAGGWPWGQVCQMLVSI